MKPNILVFDCESTSLHGRAFAVGAIVFDRKSRIEIDSFQLLAKSGLRFCNDWVKEHVLPHLTEMPTCNSLKELRDKFFSFYQEHKETADIFSDVNFPVESNFLSSIVADAPAERALQMPYPLYDIVNYVPIEVDRIKASGLPGLRKHHPLDDARASAICYLKCHKINK